MGIKKREYYAHADFNGNDHSPLGDVQYGDDYLNDDSAAAYAGEEANGAADNDGGEINDNGYDDDGGRDATYESKAPVVQSRSTAHKRPDYLEREPAHMIAGRGKPAADKVAGNAGNEPSDYDYVVKYFPGGKNVYEFDEQGSIVGTSEVTLSNRKDIKRAVCSHWYFYTFGSVASEAKAQSLATKLEKIKGNLTFTNHIKSKVF